MSSFRVRRSGREFIVEGESALVRLARAGALKGEDQLREEPSGMWTEANLHPLLWEIYQADPWAAWEDLDEAEDPEALWSALAHPAGSSGAEAPVMARPDPDQDVETLAPVKATLPPPRRRRRSSGVAPGRRWTGPSKLDGVHVPATEPDLRPGARAERPAGIKLSSGRDAPEAPSEVLQVVLPAPPPEAPPGRPSDRLAPPPDMVVSSEPTDLPPVALPSSPPGVTLPELGPRGQVIAFPERTRLGGSRAAAEPAAAEPVAQRRDPSAPAASRVVRSFSSPPAREPARQTIGLNLWRVVPVVLLVAGFIVALSWWVRFQSQATFDNIPVVEAPRPPGQTVAPAVTPAITPVVDPTDQILNSEGPDDPDSEEAALLRSLRDKLPVGSQEVRNKGDLEKALLIELSRLQILGVIIKVDIVSWAGDEAHPVPDEIELRIQADSRGEPEREIAAIGLVVGKYITHLDLRVLAFEVVLIQDDGKAMAKRPDPDAAALLYRKEIGLKSFLLSQ